MRFHFWDERKDKTVAKKDAAKKAVKAVKKEAKKVVEEIRHAETPLDHPAAQNPGGIPVTNSNNDPVTPNG